MKYLFFDTECANEFNNLCKMCSLGYVVVDENFNVLEEADFIINPESFFENRILKKILYYNEEYYKHSPSFDYYYEKIKSLFTDAVVIGHAVDNDVIILNDACDRYERKLIDYLYYDSQRIYMEYKGLSGDTPSLAKIAIDLDIERQGKKHTSVQDARISMLTLKAIATKLSLSLTELLEKYSSSKSLNNKGQTMSDLNDISHKKIYDNINKVNNKNKEFLNNYIDSLTPNENCDKLRGKIICITKKYELFHFKEMLKITNLIFSLGGVLTRKATNANVFIRDSNSLEVEYNSKINDRDKIIDNQIKDGISIEILEIDDFLSKIGFKADGLDEFVDGIVLDKKKFIRENKIKARADAIKKDIASRKRKARYKDKKAGTYTTKDLFNKYN